MLKFIIFALFVSYVAAEVDTVTCGGSSSGIIINIAGCSGAGPCTVHKETPTEITTEFAPNSHVESGKYLITALYLGFNIEITNVDVCNGVGCPITSGIGAKHTHVMTLPSSVPNIKATTTLKITDSSGDNVVCESLEVSIVDKK